MLPFNVLYHLQCLGTLVSIHKNKHKSKGIVIIIILCSCVNVCMFSLTEASDDEIDNKHALN